MTPEGLALLDAAPCGLMRTTDNGAFVFANRAFCSSLGVSAESLVARRRFQDLLTMGGKIFHQTHWSPLLRMQGSIAEVKLDLIHADGSLVPMVLNAIRHEENGTMFHELAAFFARVKSKLPWNDGGATVVSAVDKGEYLMPDMQDPLKKGSQMQPAVLDGDPLGAGKTDSERREQLAEWVTASENPWFARALTNRVWARLMGRGFYEPIDDLGNSQTPLWPEVHTALSQHFIATGYDLKDLYTLIVSTDAYRRGVRTASAALARNIRHVPCTGITLRGRTAL